MNISSSTHPAQPSLTSYEGYELEDTRTFLSQQGPKVRQRHRSARRLSSWVYFLIIFSLATILTCIGFWIWLWTVKPDQLRWRQLVLSQYAPQAITVTSLLLRTAMGVLASIGTSMIASVAIEKRGVPLESVANFSIARFINNGPIHFFNAIFERSTLDINVRLLTALLLCTTLASQFTSTLLVSDLRLGDVVDFPRSFVDAYDVGDQEQIPGTLAPFSASASLWERAPYSSEAFAEYWEPATAAADVDDTGPTIRAFLPLRVQTDRERVQGLSGTVRVVDARVVCVRPTISNLRVCTAFGSTLPALCGNVTRGKEPSNIWGPSTQQFALPLSEIPTPKYRWALTSMAGGILTNLSNVSSIEDQMASIPNGSALLTDSLGLYYQYPNISQIGLQFNLLNSTGDGAWLRQNFQHAPNNGTVAFQLSLSWCYQSFT